MPSPPRSRVLPSPVNRLDELLWRRKILRVAWQEQLSLVDVMPAFGYDSMAYEENARRLRQRMREVDKELREMGYAD